MENTSPQDRCFKLIVEYDGTGFHGWQRQPEARTIQGEIEDALKKMTGQPIIVTGSGRTDAGVHALAQVAAFRCRTRLTPEVFQRGLNSLLPDGIVIHSCEPAAADFHPRFDAVSKHYRYRILNRQPPAAIDRQYCWHIASPLDRDAVAACVERLPGSHDFKSFEGAGSPRSHTVRTVLTAKFFRDANGFDRFEIEADGFLRYMVRNIVGTLVFVGLGKMTAAQFDHVLASRDRSLAAPTAPPQGLFLVSVRYEALQQG